MTFLSWAFYGEYKHVIGHYSQRGSIGVDQVLVDLIKNMYKQAECAVVINGKITDWFQVVTGVRQCHSDG